MKKVIVTALSALISLSGIVSVSAKYFEASQLDNTKGVYISGCLSPIKSEVTLKLTNKETNDVEYVSQMTSDDYGRFSSSLKFDCENVDDYTLSVYENGELFTAENAPIISIFDKYDNLAPKINIEATEDGADISVSVSNKYFSENLVYTILTGIYDDEGKLLTTCQSNEFTANEIGETVSLGSFSWGEYDTVSKIKCFLWNNSEGLKPLNQCRIIIPSNDYRNPVVIQNDTDKNRDLTFNFLGDSITFGDLTTKPYPYFIADKLNLYYNYDFRWYVRPNYPDILHHVGNNELEINQVNDYGECGNVVCNNGGLNSKVSMLGRYNKMDPNADIIFIMGGTNDYAFSSTTWVNRELGTTDDEGDTTFCGAYYNMIKGIKNMYPTSQVVVLTPIKRNGGQNPNAHGSTLEDYVNAEIAIADKLNVPSIDLYHAPELDFDTLGWNIYTVDGLHPNEKGGELLAEFIVDKMVEKNIIEIR